jgi:hypothetical protein
VQTLPEAAAAGGPRPEAQQVLLCSRWDAAGVSMHPGVCEAPVCGCTQQPEACLRAHGAVAAAAWCAVQGAHGAPAELALAALLVPARSSCCEFGGRPAVCRLLVTAALSDGTAAPAPCLHSCVVDFMRNTHHNQ